MITSNGQSGSGLVRVELRQLINLQLRLMLHHKVGLANCHGRDQLTGKAPALDIRLLRPLFQGPG